MVATAATVKGAMGRRGAVAVVLRKEGLLQVGCRESEMRRQGFQDNEDMGLKYVNKWLGISVRVLQLCADPSEPVPTQGPQGIEPRAPVA